jgi:hypothetical protein
MADEGIDAPVTVDRTRVVDCDVALYVTNFVLDAVKETQRGTRALTGTDVDTLSSVSKSFQDAAFHVVPLLLRCLSSPSESCQRDTHYFQTNVLAYPQRHAGNQYKETIFSTILETPYPGLQHLAPFLERNIHSTNLPMSPRTTILHIHGRQEASWLTSMPDRTTAMVKQTCRGIVFSRTPIAQMLSVLHDVGGRASFVQVINDYKKSRSPRANSLFDIYELDAREVFEQDTFNIGGAVGEMGTLEPLADVVNASLPDTYLPLCRFMPNVQRLEVTGIRRYRGDPPFNLSLSHPYEPLGALANTLTTLVIDRGAVIAPEGFYEAVELPNVTSLRVFEETALFLLDRLQGLSLPGLTDLDFGYVDGTRYVFRRYPPYWTKNASLEDIVTFIDSSYPLLNTVTVRNLAVRRRLLNSFERMPIPPFVGVYLHHS